MPSINTASQAARTPLQPLSRATRPASTDNTSEADILRKLGQERARQSATQVTVSREAAAALKQQQAQQRQEATQDKAVQQQVAQQHSTSAQQQNPAPAQRENTRKAVESMYQSSNASEQGRLKEVYA
jgi:hypothetical protein